MVILGWFIFSKTLRMDENQIEDFIFIKQALWEKIRVRTKQSFFITSYHFLIYNHRFEFMG